MRLILNLNQIKTLQRYGNLLVTTEFFNKYENDIKKLLSMLDMKFDYTRELPNEVVNSDGSVSVVMEGVVPCTILYASDASPK